MLSNMAVLHEPERVQKALKACRDARNTAWRTTCPSSWRRPTATSRVLYYLRGEILHAGPVSGRAGTIRTDRDAYHSALAT